MITSTDSPPAPTPKGLGPPKKCAGLRQLVNHRDVARAFGVSYVSLRSWVRDGKFPQPHSTLGAFLLFDRALIEHRLEHGLWPAGTKFYGARPVTADGDDAVS